MKPSLIFALLAFLLIFCSGTTTAKELGQLPDESLRQDSATPLICGISLGFPPYQFSEKQQVTGFDADVARALMAELNQQFEFRQNQWENVLNELRTEQSDFIVGMEISPIRKQLFDFSLPYYFRKDAIFVLAETQILDLSDLTNQRIAGDKHSFIENKLKESGSLFDYRLIVTHSKSDSMMLLASGKVAAAIMPKAVGFYLAKQLGLKIRMLPFADYPGTPVAIAVKKGNTQLSARLNQALNRLKSRGEIQRLYQKWFSIQPQ
ncbi:transporter substrate-binding domain-containing protein [Shewanella sp. AS1]|uniref:transporter substrate-binding domain-containing protein n=1 Tax=Shewanella sp. AS1 TaxID=2907626 RepID=UPI001F24BDF0|nr:transporter substrate-binding domain-containing protein [Shewanella sp. AS1]MCE9678197.1 transporter substrate-binding domain-containing protein [Shewanella sp. AS1]